MNLLNIIKKDLQDLSIAWKAWLFVGLSSVLVVNFCGFTGFTWQSIVGLLAGLSGVTYVLFTAHDKQSAMIFGVVMVVLYGITAFINKVYGDAMQNLLYQFPILICGFLSFGKSSDKNLLSIFQKINSKISILLWACLVASYAFFLHSIGDIRPLLDSFTTVTSMFGVVLLAMRSKYQWYLWIAVNGVSSCMWYSIGGLSVMSIMWMFYLINSFVGFYVNVVKGGK